MSNNVSRKNLIWNIVKTTLLVIICVALIKIAFFPSQKTDEATPSADFSPVTTQAEVGDISNTLTLAAAVQLDPSQTAKATASGTVFKLNVSDGDAVGEGDTLFVIRKETPQEPLQGVDEMGNPTMKPRPNLIQDVAVKSPCSGKVTLSVIKNQDVMVGQDVARVQPQTFSVSATLAPDQLYRIAQMPETATVTIKDGPAPFECGSLRTASPAAAAADPTGMSGGSTSSDGGSLQAVCSVPAEVKAFAGLSATMEIQAGHAEKAVLVPVSAVEGRFESGFVFQPAAQKGDEPKKIPVKLGITDGQKIQITEGLKEGDEVLEFAPGQNMPTEDGVY